MLRQSLTRLATSATARPILPSTLTAFRQTTRTFTSLPTLRPTTMLPTAAFSRPTAFAPPTTVTALDLVPQTAISAHPAFLAAQVRCGPRNNMNGNSRLKRKRKHGFLARNRSKTGRMMLLRRREKGRCRLSN
ncbi:related to ribosomal protein L34, mitochondrial [Cephalotrichum gorgonifer]|uniref:Related to ribosomal protein L34, mitochondrial n=1 Tax=Cephalotrichum gorgonifer TaxID=2041049 RepID=A0AAE8SRJ1_9PEZI|nr:related to ribosomal protein L34, mitochondrial [Cephalotrichum gorgonifer]